MKKRCTTVLGMAICCMMLLTSAWAGDNGTISVGGKTWLKDAACLGQLNWSGAMNRVATLASGQCGLTDKSNAGQWRLPTIYELQGMFAAKSSFSSIKSYYYWSSTVDSNNNSLAYNLDMRNKDSRLFNKTQSFYVLAVKK